MDQAIVSKWYNGNKQATVLKSTSRGYVVEYYENDKKKKTTNTITLTEAESLAEDFVQNNDDGPNLLNE